VHVEHKLVAHHHLQIKAHVQIVCGWPPAGSVERSLVNTLWAGVASSVPLHPSVPVLTERWPPAGGVGRSLVNTFWACVASNVPLHPSVPVLTERWPPAGGVGRSLVNTFWAGVASSVPLHQSVPVLTERWPPAGGVGRSLVNTFWAGVASNVPLHPSLPGLTDRWPPVGGVVLFQVSSPRLRSQLVVFPLLPTVPLQSSHYCQPIMSRLDMTQVQSFCQFKYSAQFEGRI